MLGACIVVRRCFRPVGAHLVGGRSSFIPYHGQHARSSTHTSLAGAGPTSAAAGLKNNNASETKNFEASINDATAHREKDQSSSTLAETTVKPHIIGKDRGVNDPNSTNEPEKAGTNSKAVFWASPFFQSYQGGENRSTRHAAEGVYVSRTTGKDLEGSSTSSRENKSEAPKQELDTVRHYPNAAQNDRRGTWVAEGTPPLPTQQFQLPGLPGSREVRLGDLIDVQQEHEVDKPAAGVEQQMKDTLRQHSQNSQSQNNAFEGDNQTTLKISLCTGSSTEDQRLNEKGERIDHGRRFHEAIRAASVEDIEQKLHHTAHHRPNVDGVQFMLSELIKVRHVQPQAHHYEALILANCEAHHGSALALHPILAEMERERIGISASTLSAVLKVLSIHPDAQLLPRIIQAFFSQWISLSVTNTVHLILCLTRLNQFELAIANLEQLISTSPPISPLLQTAIPQYLYTTILYRLASPAIADHTAILHLLYLLHDNNFPISNVCISYILDSAAEALHLDLTLYLWRSHVDTNYIIPNTGLCRNALLTATRNDNSELMEKAGGWLESRGEMGGDGVGVWGIGELEMVKEAFGGLDMQSGRALGVAGFKQTTKRIVRLRRVEQVQEEREMKVEDQIEEEAQNDEQAVAETEDDNRQVEERDTEGKLEVQPRYVAGLIRRQRHKVSPEIKEEEEEERHQGREVDDVDDEAGEDNTKGEFKVRLRRVAGSIIYKLRASYQRITGMMHEGEQEKEVDSANKVEEQVGQHEEAEKEEKEDGRDGAEDDNTKSESEARLRWVRIGVQIRRLESGAATDTREPKQEKKMKKNNTKSESKVRPRWVKASLKIQRLKSRAATDTGEPEQEKEVEEDNTKSESEVRPRWIRARLNIQRLESRAATETKEPEQEKEVKKDNTKSESEPKKKKKGELRPGPKLTPEDAGEETDRQRQPTGQAEHDAHHGGSASESESDPESEELCTHVFAGLRLRRTRRHERKDLLRVEQRERRDAGGRGRRNG
ncbi:hypothetical protein EPUS_01582 [Endocarpon pusillum Z07020]|uniref:Pentacotripeptide-repeat region of PRORP domain-containing protein n=1 Tax=Endocarpon pusillum (strain Z07020 / HMAS-L-300199) TaxID=1263415 RepID=U1GDS5_ENDPU|nr:uncharacterized protein EPUS_01582 [Endocarpon pusillum Z07020]ERF75752.1 hypothetical protein EPUS_01582 [Endocarpon pusillum Z07020]